MIASDDLSAVREPPFARAVEKLEELLSQGRRAFLIGAGCSKCAGLPLTTELTQQVLGGDALDGTTKAVLEQIRDSFDGANNANIEDYLSELIDLLAIADRRTSRGAKQDYVSLGGSTYTAEQLRTAVEQIKKGIAQAIEKKVSVETHRQFVRTVHRPLRPGKPTIDQSVDYLVLNYDTVIEDALALECIPFADGLDGGVTGWWNPDTFDRAGLSARVFKLHGSINWCEFENDPLPRRLGARLEIPEGGSRRILIWPASTKYRETQLDPYAQLIERARQVLRPRSGSERVLVVCGYRFGDSHINLELDRALRKSGGYLTTIVFTSDNEPSGLLKEWLTDPSVRDQVLVFANRGFFHGLQSDLSTQDLVWWKFENLTRLLGGTL